MGTSYRNCWGRVSGIRIYILTRTFIYSRYLYISVIPFSVILSTMIVESFRSVTSSRQTRTAACPKWVNFITLLILTGLLTSLLTHSPLVRAYRSWEDREKVVSVVLNEISGVADRSREKYVIHINDLSRYILPPQDKIPHNRSKKYHLSRHIIQSWLNLKYPDKRVEIVTYPGQKPSFSPSPPNGVYFEITIEKNNDITVMIHPSEGAEKKL